MTPVLLDHLISPLARLASVILRAHMVTCAIHTTDSVPVGTELVEDNATSALLVTTTFLIVNGVDVIR